MTSRIRRNRRLRCPVANKPDCYDTAIQLWNIPAIRCNLHNSSLCFGSGKTLNPNQIRHSHRRLCSQRSHAGCSRLARCNRRRQHTNGSTDGNSNSGNMDGSWNRILCAKLTKQTITHPPLPRRQRDNSGESMHQKLVQLDIWLALTPKPFYLYYLNSICSNIHLTKRSKYEKIVRLKSLTETMFDLFLIPLIVGLAAISLQHI